MNADDMAKIEAVVRRVLREELAARVESGASSLGWVDHEQTASESTDRTEEGTAGTSTSSNLSTLADEGRRFIASLQRDLKQTPGSTGQRRKRKVAR